MLFIRLLAVVLILINTWLLNSAQSDHIQRYKRTMAQRADRELAHLVGEQCRSSVRHPRQSRSLFAQRHPLVALLRTHTRWRRDLYHFAGTEESFCGARGCRSDKNFIPKPFKGSKWGFDEKRNVGGISEDVQTKREGLHTHTPVSPHQPAPSKTSLSQSETLDSSMDLDKPMVGRLQYRSRQRRHPVLSETQSVPTERPLSLIHI